MANKFFALKGIVVAIKANFYEVELDINQFKEKSINRFLCQCRNRLNHQGLNVCVGDKVLVEEIDWNHAKATISDLESRQNYLIRPEVANVTDIYVLVSLHSPTFDVDQVNRFLLASENVGVNVSLVLTKSDLISDEDLRNQEKRLANWGYSPISISIENGQGIDMFLSRLNKSTLSVLCGPSGVGKSSLLKYLMPSENIRISSLSKKLNRGRHTTRHIQLYSLGNGKLIADTPGFNRPELDINPQQIAFCFPEIKFQLDPFPCKFRNCLHLDEPGCCVDKDWERYSYYRQYVQTMINR